MNKAMLPGPGQFAFPVFRRRRDGGSIKGGDEGKVVEVDEQAGEVVGSGLRVFKCGDHAEAGRLVDDLGDAGGGVGEVAEGGELMPAVGGQFEVAVEDEVHGLPPGEFPVKSSELSVWFLN